MPISAGQNRHSIGRYQQRSTVQKRSDSHLASEKYHHLTRSDPFAFQVLHVSSPYKLLGKTLSGANVQQHIGIIAPLILLLTQISSVEARAESNNLQRDSLAKIASPSSSFRHTNQYSPIPDTRLPILSSHRPASPLNVQPKEGNYFRVRPSGHQRTARFVLPIRQERVTVPPKDEIVRKRLFEADCFPSNAPLSLADILRQVGKTLQKPITQLMLESNKIISWFAGQNCPSADHNLASEQKFAKLDELISQIITLLPGSQPLAITQYIIGPLLERAADDLAGIEPGPAQQQQMNSLIQQLSQQARITIACTNHQEHQQLSAVQRNTDKNKPIPLPAVHLLNGINHVDLMIHDQVHRVPVVEKKGKVFALMAHNKQQYHRKLRIYYNYLRQKWEKMGNGYLNRFSLREQNLVSRLSLTGAYPTGSLDVSRLHPYTFSDPHQLKGESITAIEMFGRLVPFHHEPSTRENFIYDAAHPLGRKYKVAFWKNEWHLTLTPGKNIAYHLIYNPAKGSMIPIARIRKISGHPVFAQVNPETGLFWGRQYILNKHDRLVPLFDWLDKTKSLMPEDRYKEDEHIVEREESVSRALIACQRYKRGINFAELCLGNKYHHPLIGEGSISSVYDTGEGYVIKKYTGKINQEYKSRLQYANNNARGFNRYYGESSGFVSITPLKDGSATVSTRLRKIEGIALNRIKNSQNRALLTDMLLEITRQTLPENLANNLKNNGIVHYDINAGNIIYSKERGFSIIDFDSAVFYPDNQKVGQSLTEWMSSKFSYILGEARADIYRQLAILSQRQKQPVG